MIREEEIRSQLKAVRESIKSQPMATRQYLANYFRVGQPLPQGEDG